MIIFIDDRPIRISNLSKKNDLPLKEDYDLFISLLINSHHTSFFRGSSLLVERSFFGKCSYNKLFDVGGFYPKSD
jgi:hypothetical protein